MNWLFLESGKEMGMVFHTSSPIQGMAEAEIPEFVTPEQLADFVAVPRYDVDVSAGPGITPDGEAVTAHYAFSRRWLGRRNLKPNDLAVVRVSGDSMEPRLSNGNLAVIDTTDTDIKDGVTYVLRLRQDLLIKRLQVMPQSHVSLCSHNVEFEPLMVDLRNGEVKTIGRVVASMHEW